MLLLITLGCEKSEGVPPPPINVSPSTPAGTSTENSPKATPSKQAGIPSSKTPAAKKTPKPKSKGYPEKLAPLSKRLIAIGDIHGDLQAAKRSLVIAKVIDEKDHWIGGDTILVQTGDILDRGDDERAIMNLFDQMEAEASAAGGKVLRLNGNHEVMNVQGDLRYITKGGFAEFSEFASLPLKDARMKEASEAVRGRAAAFQPGGPYAMRMARQPIIAVVGDSVFVHGGVLPNHVDFGIEKINAENAAWMKGEAPMPASLLSNSSPIWSRHFSQPEVSPTECQLLQETLNRLGVARMVVGHTPQMGGANSACNGKVWRIDVGMASHYGGSAQALEIYKGQVNVLK